MAAVAKQDPKGKGSRQAAADGKVYFSCESPGAARWQRHCAHGLTHGWVCVHSDAQIHSAVSNIVARARKFQPDVIIAIGGGGFIPARMLRTELKIPVLAISLELYDDNTNTRNTTVKKTQWFDEASGVGKQVRGKRVLIMDEVDDTRTTLAFAVQEVMKTNAPSNIAVAVVHNKLKPKEAELPPNITYIAGEDVPDKWNCYPWDAAAYGRDIYAHEALAAQWYDHLVPTPLRCQCQLTPRPRLFVYRLTASPSPPIICVECVQRWREGEGRTQIASKT